MSSDLVGVTIDAPQPLNKTEQEIVPTKFLLTLGGLLQKVDLSFGKKMQITTLIGEKGPVQTALHFGEEKPKLPAQFGIWLDGNFQRIDFDEWRNFIDKMMLAHEQLTESNQQVKTPNKKKEEASNDPWLNALNLQNNKELIDRINKISLEVGSLTLFNQQFSNIDIVARRSAGDWKIYAHNDLLKGSFIVPDEFEERGQIPIVVSLDYLHLPAFEKTKEPLLEEVQTTKSKQASGPAYDIEPSSIPAINLDLSDLAIGEKSYGRWKFQARPDLYILDSVLFESMDFEFNQIHFQGNAIWRKTENGLINYFNGTANAKNVKSVMQNWGYSVPLTTQSASLTMDVNWSGMPWDIDYANVNGDVDVTITEAILKNIDSKTEAIKALGFLSLNNLSRRLKLNFSDLYADGLELDKIEGKVDLDNGVLSTNKIKIDATFAEDMSIYGSTNMINEKLDMKMDMTIPVSSSLLPACILGVAVCAGVVVTSTLLKSELDKITSVSYDITGTWKDPIFTVVKR